MSRDGECLIRSQHPRTAAKRGLALGVVEPGVAAGDQEDDPVAVPNGERLGDPARLDAAAASATVAVLSATSMMSRSGAYSASQARAEASVTLAMPIENEGRAGLPMFARSASRRRYTIGVDEVRTDQRAYQTNPLLDQVDGRSVQLKLVAPTHVPAQVERPPIADQCAEFVDPRSYCRHPTCPFSTLPSSTLPSSTLLQSRSKRKADREDQPESF